MKVVGIVAEYNPFHAGHAYQVAYARETLPADYVIAVMSGDFVQRGTPAIFDKYDRTKAALSMGVDLVIELPAIYATASAEIFAYGAILALNETGIVDEVLFGCEDDDLNAISLAADILLDEPALFKDTLHSSLNAGDSFACARGKALTACGVFYPIDKPNNILAVEYVKAIKSLGSTMTPHPMKRIGSDYHDTNVSASFASATAIREAIAIGEYDNAFCSLPDALKSQYQSLVNTHRYVLPENMSLLVHHALLQASDYSQYSDFNEEISQRILHVLNDYAGYESFCALMKTKNITMSRIQRCLCHLLLNIKESDVKEAKSKSHLSYLRVLGCWEESTKLLGELTRRSFSCVLTNLGEYKNSELFKTNSLLQLDLAAADTYRALVVANTGIAEASEFSRKFVK